MANRITYEIDNDMLVIHQNGVTDTDEITEAVKVALADANLVPGSHLVWDAKTAPAQATPEKMEKLLRDFIAIGPRVSSRIALVVETELQYGVSRMFSVYAEEAGLDAKVFYELDAAKAWLRE